MKAPEGFREALAAAFRDSGRVPPEIHALGPLAGGSIHQAFRLHTSQGEFFCKWNPRAPADMFAREKEGLQALAASGTSLIIPRIMAVTSHAGDLGSLTTAAIGSPTHEAAGSPTDSPPSAGVLVLEFLAPAPGGPDEATWEKMGIGLAQLHRHAQARFGFAHGNYCGLTAQANAWCDDWPEFFRRNRIGPLLEKIMRTGAWGAREAAVFDSLSNRLPALLDHHPGPSLIHGDLWSGNFLATKEGPALIDPAAHFADRECDLAMMMLFGGFPETVFTAYAEVWPLPSGWRERIPLYQLYHVLNHFLLFGGGYGEQALRIARRFL